MSHASGHVIIRGGGRMALINPIVYDELPANKREKLAVIFAKALEDWDEEDDDVVKSALAWAWHHFSE